MTRAIATVCMPGTLAEKPAALRPPIPGNYYEDLAARLDLDDAAVERLRRHSILYDRPGTGELFHFFTPPINGLFFEVLERRGYARCGEANTAVRLAAQAGVDRSLSERLTEIKG